MSTPITSPVPQWVRPLTVHGGTRPSGADMLEVLTSHADRSELALWGQLMQRAQMPANALSWAEHRPTAQVLCNVAADATLYSPALIAHGAAVTHPGSPTLDAPVVSAWSDTLTIVTDDANSYRTNSAGALQAAVAFAGITAVADVIYCTGSGLFIAVGSGGGVDCRVETTATGTSWTARSTDATAPCAAAGASSFHRALATYGSNVLCLQAENGTACKQGWSADGGLTWTWTAHSGGSGTQLMEPVYDPILARWLAVSNEYASEDIYYNANPGAGATWTKLCDKPEALTTSPLIVTDTGLYLFGNYYSRDGGLTWRYHGLGVVQEIVGGRLRTLDTNHYATGIIARGVLGY